MKIHRSKNAIRNMYFGVFLKCYQIIIPFLMRTAMIRFMGIQYLGLNSLFTNILHVLNIAELGVGSAMVYSMYKPIVDNDSETINALMRLYRTYYRIIGSIIAAVGIILTPFIPYLIKSDLPEGMNVYILYLLNLGATILSYWLFAYKNCLLQAHQRNDVISKVTLITNTFQYLTQFLVMVYLKNYYIYIIVMLFTQAATNIITALTVKRIYPEYKAEGKLDKDTLKSINKRIRDLFTAKIGTIIVNSSDTIVISAFLGLTVLAVYQNYYFILTSIISVITIVFQSCTAGIGNSLIVESKEKNFRDLKIFTLIISWVSGFCTACLLCLYQPFMTIWVGEELKLKFSAVVCFCVYYYVYEINQLLNTYKDAAGIWHKDRFRPLVTALVNLTLNLILVNFWGIYGVLLSTAISMVFVGMPWILNNLFTTLFDKKMLKGYIINLIFYSGISLLGCVFSYFLCRFVNISGIPGLIIRLLICLVSANAVFLIFLRKKEDFFLSLQFVNKIFHGKLNRFIKNKSA